MKRKSDYPDNPRCSWYLKSVFFWVLGFVFWGGLDAGATIYTQNEQEIMLSMKAVYLKDVLWEIEKQTNFVFMYNEEEVDCVGKIDIEIKTSDIGKILSQCLKGTGLTYVIEDSVIVIKPQQKRQQPKEVSLSGRVTDMTGAPMPGVTVRIKELKLGNITNVDGRYNLRFPAADNQKLTLMFSFVGMKTREIKYTGQKKLDVVMEEEEQKLESVVVTGFNKLRKESFTGTATVVSKEELLRTNNKNAVAALSIFDPSFRITQNSVWGSDPNNLPEIILRGQSSLPVENRLDLERDRRNQRTNLQGNPNLPIFILDGFEVNVQVIYDMDINRIASMTILKDAAATAVYGSRAAKGVVVVTSVAPKPGELRISYNTTLELTFPDLSDYNLANAEEKLEIERLGGVYTAESPSMQIYRDQEFNDRLNEVRRGVYTDWLALPLRNAYNARNSVNLSGGTETVRFSLDFSYDDNKGAMRGSFRKRMGAAIFVDYRFRNILTFTNRVSYNRVNAMDSPYGVFSEYVKLQPYDALYDREGNYIKRLPMSNVVNPLWRKENLNDYSGDNKVNTIINNLAAKVNFTDYFWSRVSFSVMKQENRDYAFLDPNGAAFSNVPARERGSLKRKNDDKLEWTFNAQLLFNRHVGKHFFNAVLGADILERKAEKMYVEWRGFQLGNMDKPGFAAFQPNKTNIDNGHSRIAGYYTSLNYSYDETWLFDGSMRWDGSSLFSKNKKFAFFSSVGLGVNIHNMKWFKGNDILSQLKLRGTIGTTGKVGYSNMDIFNTFIANTEEWYYTGPTMSLAALANPDLTWSKVLKKDAGFILGLFKDRFYLEATYYHEKNKNEITDLGVEFFSGFSKMKANQGTVLNEGIELKTNFQVFNKGDWSIVLNANLARNKNTIVELSETVEEYNKKVDENFDAMQARYPDLVSRPMPKYYVGKSVSAIYAVPSHGIDPASGKEEFVKKDGTPTFTYAAEDQVVVGDKLATANGTIGVNIGWKNIYLNANFMYEWGGQIYNTTLLEKVEKAPIATSNVDKRVLSERWKKVGDVAPFYDIQSKTDTKPTSRFVQDNNVLSFSTLSVGYDFRREIVKKLHLSSLGLRFNANDIARWSTVKVERGLSYPYAKTFSFTLSANF